ncbi:glycosyl hydrolase family 18 protein [Acetonema longum]|uniref:Chitinase n=1 Tax=Acetonema longum DSM 6540 TaxID=1009370 RepID=F7NJ76_9FIRM|nr:glycosyl hydrolase family 18 protein [Acetonema longum]EGO63903.1 chitinase [Acetonema longum DSM 6540]
MERKYWWGLAAAVVILTGAGIWGSGHLGGGSGALPAPAPKVLPQPLATPEQQTVQPRLIIGYYENPWPGTGDSSGSLPSMKAFGKAMTAVAPFWYKIRPDGTLESKYSQVVYDTAKQMGLAVYPLMINQGKAIDTILADSRGRTKVIDNIVKEITARNYDGVNIDFEQLAPKHRLNLNMFAAELYLRLKPINKTVIFSVFPQIDVTEDVSGAYDYVELAKNADFLQIMTYDKHWPGSDPGPIAPIDWYEENIQYAIERAGGPHKIIVGVGAYGYDWPREGEADYITYVEATLRAERNAANIQFDAVAKAPHFSYGGRNVWFEDVQSTGAKLDVIAKHNPAGIAIWRIGQEQPEMWREIEKKFPRNR